MKLRAWHKRAKEIFLLDTPRYDKEASSFKMWLRQVPPTDTHTGDWELMRSTGLKDKNGKEVYEGDIVKMLDFGMPDFTKPARILWGDWQELGWYYLHEGDYARSLIGGKSPHRVEVIGNIWEHLHLLK